jgi:hypothetical protein
VSMESFSKNHVETGNFPYGFCIKMVSYWLHMDCVVMAHLKNLSLDIFLRYFDHLSRILCVSMDPYSKNHVETGKFPYGLCIILVRYGWCSNGSPKISFFRYFLKIF